MANANDKTELLYQNLHDARCDEALIEKCMLLVASYDIPQMIKLLDAYKETMLASVNRKEKRIDCVDFLIYSLKKELK